MTKLYTPHYIVCRSFQASSYHYWSRLVNIALDALNIKKVLVNIGKDWLISVKMLVDAY